MTEQLKGFRGTDYIPVRREDVEYMLRRPSSFSDEKSLSEFYTIRDRLSAALSAEPVVSGLEWRNRLKGLARNCINEGNRNSREKAYILLLEAIDELTAKPKPEFVGIDDITPSAFNSHPPLSPVKQEPDD